MASKVPPSPNSRSVLRPREGDQGVPSRPPLLFRAPAPTRGDVALLVLGALVGFLFGGGALGAGLLSLVLVIIVAAVVFVVAKLGVPFVARRLDRSGNSFGPTFAAVGAVIFVAAVVLADIVTLSLSIGTGIVLAIGTLIGWRFYDRDARVHRPYQVSSRPYAAHAFGVHRRQRGYR